MKDLAETSGTPREGDTVREGNLKEVLTLLARAGGRNNGVEDMVEFNGRKITLPEGSTIRENIDFLEEREEEEETITNYMRQFRYKPWDGAWAATQAIKRVFGSVVHKGAMGFWGRQPPVMIDVPTGPNGQKEQIPWGAVVVPGLPDVEFTFGGGYDTELGQVFVLTAEGAKKYKDHIEGLFNLVEEELETNSLYRGKAFDGSEMPQFLDPYSVDKNNIVYNDDTAVQLEANIVAPIRYPDKLAKIGISPKRAVLLSGPFGTGKTSTAMLVAQEAIENGWTFVYARHDQSLEEVLQTAKQYEPAVVFFEDLDKVTSLGDRDTVAALLDMFDGAGSKDARILAILTTNYKERITAGMLRPGRLDAIVEIGFPSEQGIRRILEQKLQKEGLGGIKGTVDWTVVAEACDQYVPAFLEEVASRAIRYGLVRSNGNLASVKVTQADLVYAADELRSQWRLMGNAPEHTETPTLDTAFTETIHEVVTERLNDFAEVSGFRYDPSGHRILEQHDEENGKL